MESLFAEAEFHTDRKPHCEDMPFDSAHRLAPGKLSPTVFDHSARICQAAWIIAVRCQKGNADPTGADACAFPAVASAPAELASENQGVIGVFLMRVSIELNEVS